LLKTATVDNYLHDGQPAASQNSATSGDGVKTPLGRAQALFFNRGTTNSMKRIITIMALSAATIVSGFAQGYVFFQNSTATRVSVNSLGGSTFTLLPNVADQYYFALFYSTSEDTVNGSTSAVTGFSGSDLVLDDPGWSFTGDMAANIASVKGGMFMSLTTDSNFNTEVPIPSPDAASFVVLGWSANIGSTESDLAGYLEGAGPFSDAYIGESAPSGFITVGAGGDSLTPNLFGVAPSIKSGFELADSIPEPPAMALGGLGALALLALCRRRA
jgi:hypothetical protein